MLKPGKFAEATGESIPQAEPGTEARVFFNDTVHPGPNGHLALAELLVGLVARGAIEAASGISPQAREAPRPAPLPPPMQPGLQEAGAALCAMEDDFQRAGVSSSGFLYRAFRPDAPSRAQQKWGWIGERVGKEAL